MLRIKRVMLYKFHVDAYLIRNYSENMSKFISTMFICQISSNIYIYILDGSQCSFLLFLAKNRLEGNHVKS